MADELMVWAKDKEKDMERLLHEVSNWTPKDRISDNLFNPLCGYVTREKVMERIHTYRRFYSYVQHFLAKLSSGEECDFDEFELKMMWIVEEEKGFQCDYLSRMHLKFTAGTAHIKRKIKQVKFSYLRQMRDNEYKKVMRCSAEEKTGTTETGANTEMTKTEENMETTKTGENMETTKTDENMETTKTERNVDLSGEFKELVSQEEELGNDVRGKTGESEDLAMKLQSLNENLYSQIEELKSDAKQKADENEELWKRLKKEESVNALLGTRQRELLNDVLRKTDEFDYLTTKFEELQSLYESLVSEQVELRNDVKRKTDEIGDLKKKLEELQSRN